MPLIPWGSFSNRDRFFGDDDWLMPVLPRTEFGKPEMDIYETEDNLVAEASLPDYDPEKIDISVENGILRISGRMEKENEEEEKDYWRKEIKKGSFERMVRLPTKIKEDEVEAAYEKGVLKIIMPKAEPGPSNNRIEIEERD